MTLSDLRRGEFIKKNLEPVSLTFCDDLRYYRAHLASGLARLGRLGDKQRQETPPYWAYLWPGGSALVQFILQRAEEVRNKRVLDLGSGSGLIGIVAKRMGATHVIASDCDPMARAATQVNAALNEVSVETISGLSSDFAREIDLVTAGDLFYAKKVSETVIELLDRFLDQGCRILVGDIGRSYLPTQRLLELASFPVLDVGDRADAERRDGRVFEYLDISRDRGRLR